MSINLITETWELITFAGLYARRWKYRTSRRRTCELETRTLVATNFPPQLRQNCNIICVKFKVQTLRMGFIVFWNKSQRHHKQSSVGSERWYGFCIYLKCKVRARSELFSRAYVGFGAGGHIFFFLNGMLSEKVFTQTFIRAVDWDVRKMVVVRQWIRMRLIEMYCVSNLKCCSG